MNPEDLLKLSKEDLIEKLTEFDIKEKESMENMVMIRQELLTRLEEAKKDGELIGEYAIKKQTRVSFKTTLDEAKELGAVKEAVNTDTLKRLYNQGIQVPGVSVTVYLAVRRISQEEGEK
jgi:alpha-amylase/alpha-mannosidase (GH57 family)